MLRTLHNFTATANIFIDPTANSKKQQLNAIYHGPNG